MRRAIFAGLVVVAMSLASCAAGPASVGDRLELQVEQNRWRSVIDRSLPSYVFIGGGSGAIISDDGYMVTNNHVVGTSKVWRVKTAAGRAYVADVTGVCPETDLAVLKIRNAKSLPFLPLGDSDRMSVGDAVLAIGNPFALGSADHTPTVTFGILSATGVPGPNVGDTLATDTPINPGNSGGPLINRDGELVGINYGQIPSRFGIHINNGNGYAITSNQLKRFLKPLQQAKGKQVEAAGLNGAKFETRDDGRVVVREVAAQSPAGAAGLKAGDVVEALGPWTVTSLDHLYALASRYPADSAGTIAVSRDNGRHELPIEMAATERVVIGAVFDRKDQRSLEVERVLPGSPADQAGLRAGDIIRSIGPMGLPHRQAMQNLFNRAHPGQKVPLTIARRGRLRMIVVELVGVSELKPLLSKANADGAWLLPATQPDGPDSQPDEQPTSQPDDPPTTLPEELDPTVD